MRFVRQRLIDQIIRRNGSTNEIAAAQTALDENALTIGFARRFATYKRGNLIFRDADRLAGILSGANRPVQLIFAGKAHPKDMGGQAFAKAIFKRAAERTSAGVSSCSKITTWKSGACSPAAATSG